MSKDRLRRKAMTDADQGSEERQVTGESAMEALRGRIEREMAVCRGRRNAKLEAFRLLAPLALRREVVAVTDRVRRCMVPARCRP